MTKRNPIIAGILLRDLETPRTLGDLRRKAMALRAKVGPNIEYTVLEGADLLEQLLQALEKLPQRLWEERIGPA